MEKYVVEITDEAFADMDALYQYVAVKPGFFTGILPSFQGTTCCIREKRQMRSENDIT